MAVHLSPTARWTRAYGGSSTFTIRGWIELGSLPVEPDFFPLWYMDNGSGGGFMYLLAGDNGAGAAEIAVIDAGGEIPGPTVDLGDRVFLALRRSGTTNTLFWRFEGENTLRSVSATGGSITTTTFNFGWDGGESADATYSRWRISESALSESDIMLDSTLSSPASTVWADWPFTDTTGNAVDDASANARDLTYTAGGGSIANGTAPDTDPTGAYVVGFNGGNTGANDTTPTLTYPTVPGGILVDDIVVALTGMDGNTAVTWPAPFAEIKDEAGNGSACRASVAWDRAAGGETGTFDTTQGTEGGGWQILVIRGAHASTDPAISTGVSSSAANGGNPDSLDPGGWGTEQTLWIAAMVNDGNVAVTAGPSGYSGFANNRWANTAGAGVATAYRSTLAASEDPGAFTHAAEDARAFTIGIRPADSAVALVVADAAHAHAVDGVAVTQVHALAVADAGQAQAAESVAVTQLHQLAVADASQGQAADNVTVTATVDLVPSDAGHTQTADGVVLTQAHALTVAGSTHGHTAESPGLTQAHSLVSGDASHTQTVDSVTVTQAHALAVVDAAQAQSAETPTLTQVHALAVADALHGQAAESPTVTESGPQDLVVADALHAQSADSVALGQVHLLAVGDATQGQTADGLVVGQAHVLAPADAGQGQTAEGVVLGQLHLLVVADALHAQVVQTVALTSVQQADHSQGTWDPGGSTTFDPGVGALVYEERTGPLTYDAQA